MKSSSIPELKTKGNKFSFEANKWENEEMNEANKCENEWGNLVWGNQSNY